MQSIEKIIVLMFRKIYRNPMKKYNLKKIISFFQNVSCCQTRQVL